MKFLDILSTASSNMFRSRLRSTLTIIAIFIGAFTLTLTTGLGLGISRYIDDQVNSLGAKDVLVIMGDNQSSGLPSEEPKKYDPDKRTTTIESEGNRTVSVLTRKDLDKIRSFSGIKSAEAYTSPTVTYVTDGSKDKYLGTVNIYLDGANYTLDAGKIIDNKSSNYQVLVPHVYLDKLGYKEPADAIGKTMRFGITDGLGQTKEVTATIVGALQKTIINGSFFVTSTSLTNELQRVQHVGLPEAATTDFQMATARFDTSLSDAQLTDLKKKLKDAGYSAQTVQDQIGSLKSIIKGIIMVLNGFAAIALLAASFGIINTLLMSVQERTKEIGLMKAMGMSASRIFLLFSSEAAMLGLWGSIIGSLAAIGVGKIINAAVMSSILKDLVGLKLLSFSPLSVTGIVGLVMVIAFLAGTLPAIRAARQNPIDSLRYE